MQRCIRTQRIDYVSMAIAMLGISIPNFVLGPTLVLLFGLTWYVLPPARWEGFGVYMILPVLTLSAIYMAYIARLTRSGMLEVLRSNYIRTARAKGLPERQILWRHAMRGGLLPVVSFSGPALALLLTGTVVVERIFALPGLGNYFINANLNRDEPLIIGIVAFISIVVLIFNLLVDIAYGFIDPRVRYLADLKVGTTTAIRIYDCRHARFSSQTVVVLAFRRANLWTSPSSAHRSGRMHGSASSAISSPCWAWSW